ncbi:Nucleolar protein 8 [Bagarius yarrelli]|uniref:Nucleolar protein 8 n=1 Tax=Bagarius yarrelli TaxID=175774 RepID=A0A556U3T5_BAGYA|nr:Nucleolar protein 8 [Bagarius yarrelli]
MKRLYVGGLSHTISQKDLRDRFGKFGEVCDVEIITRKDENGSPLKTFSYVNINISDSDYKRFFKYDPSKHCHNIKKLEAEESFTPVSKLTWQIEGGDDEISKKRRGEFPAQKKRTTKTKSLDPCSVLYSAPERCAAVQNRDTGPRLLPAHKPPVCVFDSDADSEDELRMLVTQERLRNHRTDTEENENIEVVGDDFVVKPSMLWGGGEARFNLPPERLKPPESDEEYDSADTDEILTQNKTSGKVEDRMDTESCNNKSSVKSETIKEKKPAIKNAQSPNESESENDSESSNHSIDSDYEAMMGTCQRLELSLGDLEHLVKNMEEEDSDVEEAKNGSNGTPKPSSVQETRAQISPSKKSCINPEDILAALFGPDEDKEDQKKNKKVKKSCLPAFVGTKDLFNSTTVHTGLKREAEKVSCEFGEEPKRLKSDLKTKQGDDSSKAPVHTMNIKDLTVCTDWGDVKHSEPKLTTPKHLPGSTSSSAEEDEEQTVSLETKAGKAHGRSASGSTEESEISSDEEEERSSKQTEADLKSSSKRISENPGSGPQPFQQCVLDPVKQQQDNQKRLAALEQRQKEAEQQKKLIQGALSKVDLPNANRGKHIVFDSDDEVNNDSDNTKLQKVNIFDEDSDEDDESGFVEALDKKDLKKAEGSRLFDSSEDEDDGTEEDRFKIKPQFEGKAGQKLMELQSRFGTDPRFQMDSKFLESDDDEQKQEVEPQQTPGEQDLIEEKKKNLSILQSVLNVNIEPCDTRKGATKGKIFKDISALHYDPSSDTHAAFETKTDTPKKESKAARRKKREEAMKLPEVSKDIYYDVTTDLKEVFGMGKEMQNEKKAVSWDQDDDDDDDDDKDMENKEEDMHLFSFSANQEAEPSSGFKFSFFENDAITKTPTTDEYKVEPIKGPKVSWQVDPRFQDSSSEEEMEEEEEEEEKENAQEEKEEKEEAALIMTTERPAPKKKFFFFFDDDIRLKEGPSMFCRHEKLEDQREAWEERRQDLREEYRKKHKDAKRRFKIRTKS